MTERTLYVHVADHTTQFVVAGDDAPRMYEIPLGCVQLTRDELGSDPPRAEELSNTIAMVQNYLDDVLRELPEVAHCSHAIGLGRTTRILAAVELGVPESAPEIEGFRLSRRGRGRVPYPRHRDVGRPTPQPGPSDRARLRHRRRLLHRGGDHATPVSSRNRP